jgi:acetylornithine deacetylase/succinyl-diaminopimelate desuccinylase-like protein
VGFAFAVDDENIHAPNEFFRLTNFERSKVAYCRLLQELAHRTG